MNRYITPEERQQIQDDAFSQKFIGLMNNQIPVEVSFQEAEELRKASGQIDSVKPDLANILAASIICTNLLSTEDVSYYIKKGTDSFNKSASMVRRDYNHYDSEKRRNNYFILIQKAYRNPELLNNAEIQILSNINENVAAIIQNKFNYAPSNFIDRAARFFAGDESVAEGEDFIFIGKAAMCESIEDLVHSTYGNMLDYVSMVDDTRYPATTNIEEIFKSAFPF